MTDNAEIKEQKNGKCLKSVGGFFFLTSSVFLGAFFAIIISQYIIVNCPALKYQKSYYSYNYKHVYSDINSEIPKQHYKGQIKTQQKVF